MTYPRTNTGDKGWGTTDEHNQGSVFLENNDLTDQIKSHKAPDRCFVGTPTEF